MSSLNPRVDFAFKKLFGSEGSEDILLAFINAVITPKVALEKIILLNPFNSKEHQHDKYSILDVKAIDENGQQYNIEMQITDQVYYNERALYYWSKLYSSQLYEGNEYDQLRKTISINILNFNCFDEPDYHNIFRLLNVKTQACYFEHLEMHFIELKKFDKDILHLHSALERWVSFLKKADRYTAATLPKELKNDPSIDKAMHLLERLYLNDEEREIYDAQLKWLRDEAATLQKAVINTTEKIARNMLNQGLSKELIASVTGLTLETIQSLMES